MRRAVCPGSYDPVTFGHIDVFERAAKLFDEVVITVMVNPKKHGLFSIAERMDLITSAVTAIPNVRVDSWQGLLVDYCRENDIVAITKGLRAVSDFDYELQMAQMNHRLTGVETLFMPTNPEYSFLSSSLVKEVATYGGDVSHLLPDVVHTKLLERLAEQR